MNCQLDTYGFALAAFWPSLAAVVITFLILLYREGRDNKMLKASKPQND